MIKYDGGVSNIPKHVYALGDSLLIKWPALYRIYRDENQVKCLFISWWAASTSGLFRVSTFPTGAWAYSWKPVSASCMATFQLLPKQKANVSRCRGWYRDALFMFYSSRWRCVLPFIKYLNAPHQKSKLNTSPLFSCVPTANEMSHRWLQLIRYWRRRNQYISFNISILLMIMKGAKCHETMRLFAMRCKKCQ